MELETKNQQLIETLVQVYLHLGPEPPEDIDMGLRFEMESALELIREQLKANHVPVPYEDADLM